MAVSGVGARAADDASAEAIAVGVANDDKMKAREIAVIDLLVDIFVIVFDVCCSRKYLPIARVLTF
jgi:hypothetical protein